MSIEIESRDPRVYELGYLVLPTVGDAKIADVVSTLKKTISHHSGEQISEGAAELIDLAYDMSKVIENKRHTFQTAYFGWVKFEVAPDKLESIKAMLDSNGDLLRYLLIGTIKEDTMTKKRVMARRTHQDDNSTATTRASMDTTAENVEAPAVAVDETKLEEALDTIVA
jgi:ribosomal protein S6